MGEFLGAVRDRQTRALPENFVGPRDRPRASAINNCARAIAYMMAGTPADAAEPRRADMAYTQEQGRMMEDLSFEAINDLGHFVQDRQRALSDESLVTGHPDGVMHHTYGPDGVVATLEEGGLRWGVEHKHLGRWQYEHIFQDPGGIESANIDYIAQSLSYGKDLGWDAVLYVITAQDASSTRSDWKTNYYAKNPRNRWSAGPGGNGQEWNPKVQLIAIDLRPLYITLWPRVANRASWFSRWKKENGDPSTVMREFDPTLVDRNGETVFPCGYCERLDLCKLQGQGTLRAPEIEHREITAEIEF